MLNYQRVNIKYGVSAWETHQAKLVGEVCMNQMEGHVSNLGSKNTRWCTVLRHLSNRFCPENHVVPIPISTRHFSRPLWGPILFQPIWPRPVWSTHHQGLRTSLHFHLSNLVYRCLYLLWLFALIYIYLHAFASIIISYIKHLIIFTLICICMFIYLHLLTCIFALIYMYYLLYLLS